MYVKQQIFPIFIDNDENPRPGMILTRFYNILSKAYSKSSKGVQICRYPSDIKACYNQNKTSI
jgi:hypothetical protein